MWREARVATEYLKLLRDPIFKGRGVPDGGGQPVILIPGFLAGDGSMSVLAGWLTRANYRAELPGLTFNVRYSELVLKQLSMRLAGLSGGPGRGAVLVGHSRGGILAKVLSHRHPQAVERVVTLGSPLAAPFDLHPLTMAGVRLAHAYNFVRYGRTASVERRFLRDLEAPARVPTVSIYSRTDGIVHWTACIRPDVEPLEVRGSHVGLPVNAEVYRQLARLLGWDGRTRAEPG